VALLNDPSPAVDQLPLVAAPLNTAPSVAVPFSQIVCAGPASTVAAGFIVMTTLSVTGPHGPAGSFVVNVNITLPAARSAVPGVYTADSELALLNVPSPGLDQVADETEGPKAPARVTVLPEHIVWGGPASTVATALIVISTLSLTGRQGPAGSLVVRVSVTLPLEMSVGPGEYTAFIRLALLNVPSPEEVQVALVADPPKDPDSAAAPSAQMV
jgi:hypothetical protein